MKVLRLPKALVKLFLTPLTLFLWLLLLSSSLNCTFNARLLHIIFIKHKTLNVAQRQAPEQPEKRDTLTGYWSQLPHAEIFVTQLIACVCLLCVCVCKMSSEVVSVLHKNVQSISITIYIFVCLIGKANDKNKDDYHFDFTVRWRSRRHDDMTFLACFFLHASSG